MKYIIEFEDEPCMYEDEAKYYKCIQAPWWGLSERVIERLTPYQPEPTQEIQDILDYLDTVLHPIVSPEHWDVYSKLHDMVSSLPSAQPEPKWIPCFYQWKFISH